MAPLGERGVRRGLLRRDTKSSHKGSARLSSFNYARDNGRLILVLNPEHPFFKQVYKPLLDSDGPRGHRAADTA